MLGVWNHDVMDDTGIIITVYLEEVHVLRYHL